MPGHPGLSPTLTGFTSGVSTRRLKLFKSLVSTDFTTRALHDAQEPTLSTGSCLAPDHQAEPRSYALDVRNPLSLLTFRPGGTREKDLTKQILSPLRLPISPSGQRCRWRRGSESNRHRRLCRPLHNHSATPPGDLFACKTDILRNARGLRRARPNGPTLVLRRAKKREAGLPFLRIWSGKRGSNSRPQPWQGCALPTELFPRKTMIIAMNDEGVKTLAHEFFSADRARQVRPPTLR